MARALEAGSSEITGIQERMWAEVEFLKTLFSRRGLLVAIYIVVGISFNTAAPHLPTTPGSASSFHSWGQYIISVLFWPLSLWHPIFTLGKWFP
jgi:hypothetical protein